MKELWKDIEGYENMYQVSNRGNVKSLKRKVKRLLQLNTIKDGYLGVTLSNGGLHSFSVHRLVAKAFILNPENKLEVNHKKGIKTDNRATELEWVTKGENEKHAYSLQLKTAINKREVVVYFKNGILKTTYPSVTEASNNTNIPICNIFRCLKGSRKSAGGLKWKYKTNINDCVSK